MVPAAGLLFAVMPPFPTTEPGPISRPRPPALRGEWVREQVEALPRCNGKAGESEFDEPVIKTGRKDHRLRVPSADLRFSMKTLTAYLAGVATVVGSIAVGFGSALMVTSGPQPATQSTRLEQRLADQSPPAPTQTAIAAVPAAQSTNPGDHANSDRAPSAAPAAASQSTALPATASVQPPQPDAQLQPGSAAQFHSDFQDQHSQNSYARANGEDLRRYLQKRDRRWARRHLRDNDEGAAASTSSPTIAQSTAEPNAQPSQPDARPQTADDDVKRSVQKRNRRWAKQHFRNNDEDNPSVIGTAQTPRDGLPPFGERIVVHSRPFFGFGSDDD